MAVSQASGGTGNLTDVELRSYRVLNDGTIALAMCNPDGTALNSVLNSTITSTSANALVVGPNGATNPTFNVDGSVSSEATGLNVVGAAAASGLALQTLSSGSNENLKVDAKGTGTVGINTVGTTSGLVTLGNSSSLAGAAVNGPLKATTPSANALAVGLAGTTNPALQVDASTGSSATGVKVKSAAAASGVAVSTISSGTNENMTVDAKGSGTLTLNGTATGNVIPGANLVLAANKGLSMSSGSGSVDFSSATGTFKFPTGVASGQKWAVTASGGSTRTLTAANSGSANLLDAATGVTYTLPAPAVGLFYDFIVTTSVTSNNHKIITDTGTTLLMGGLAMLEAAGTTNLNALGNGTTHVAVTMNGTTTGGLIGTWMRIMCVSATQWNVTGIVAGSGTLATPFATS